MSIVGFYILFALTTSLASLVELVYPVISRRKKEQLESPSAILLYSVFLLLNALAAPLVFFSCIVPSWGTRFRESLYKGLYPKA